MAIEDLNSAHALFDTDLYEAAVYHTQQSAEKALKALLSEHNHEPEKTHDVVSLVNACAQQIDSQIRELLNEARFLKPFATGCRYPGDYFVPQEIEVLCALDAAEKMLEIVLRLLDFYLIRKAWKHE